MNTEYSEQLNKARWLMYYNQPDQAQSVLRGLLAESKSDCETMYLLAVQCYRRKQFTESLQYLEQAQKIEPDTPVVLQLIYNNYSMLGKAKEAAETARYLSEIEKTKETVYQTRRYLRPEYSLEDTFTQFNQQKINYVVLRWFEEYPQIEEGEDVDILVYDDDMDRLNPFFTSLPLPGSIPFDVYSTSGMPGSAFENLPYYPLHLAHKILLNKKLYKDLFYVPSTKDHFHSLAYHALYHKDVNSGLPLTRDTPPATKNKNHDYKAALESLAKQAMVDVEITMDTLHEYLLKTRWVPGTDLMRKLGLFRQWVRTKAAKPTRMQETGDAEFGAFIIRDWAAKPEILEHIKKLIQNFGFEILHEEPLPADARKKASLYIRSGNWNRDATGVFEELNSGGPAVFLSVVDMHPLPLSDSYAYSHPYVTNDRFRAKELIRKKIIDTYLEPGKTTNPLHSADDELEAFEYVDICIPDKKQKLLKQIQQKAARLGSPYPVKQILRKGDRGKVELIVYKGKPAIKKTFRDHSLEFLKGEILVAETLSKEVTMFPALLEKGENYIITPYYRDLLANNTSLRKKVLTKEAAVIGTLFRYFFEKGLMHLDLHPLNFILCKQNGLFLIDHEYVQSYNNKPAHISESYDVKGVPADFDGLQPMNHILAHDDYDYQKVMNDMWYQYTGYTIAGLVLKSLEGSKS